MIAHGSDETMGPYSLIKIEATCSLAAFIEEEHKSIKTWVQNH